ncbi:hypothetical protein RRG08_004735 [Elysia crispata]|uniref:Uncharacterized protein n=1 Tax=Elysia crispata TaxID=231223 RepID=A0AAE1AJ44_9GAST|nr:hypothetical protein RRG08_004735 [Elysia crispata]
METRAACRREWKKLKTPKENDLDLSVEELKALQKEDPSLEQAGKNATHLIEHDIQLTSTDPIRKRPHPVPQSMRETMQPDGKLMRWSLLLNQYRFQLRSVKGRDNHGPDFLSRT